ncbi:uncharacterized protein LOC114727421 [Neltuma alba]|uniref:uncharacterized protein LOC114727421 n=1 Tax=Neltuma alba TaxID=207710 RepID=UPI0010A4AEE4|nr:uncharacterized protein LOC114727421 [Prosopis alba]
MKILMTPELLAQLQNLETVSVVSCESMEEIVGESYCSGNTSNPTITLSKVRSLKLNFLSQLTFVFRGIMLCPSLHYFEASYCEKLSPPHIEIKEGCKLQMQKAWMGQEIYWKYDSQEQEHEQEDKYTDENFWHGI